MADVSQITGKKPDGTFAPIALDASGAQRYVLDPQPGYSKYRVQTTDATPLDIASFTPAVLSGKTIRVQVTAVQSDGAKAYSAGVIAAFKRAAATTTQVGATTALYTAIVSAAFAVAIAFAVATPVATFTVTGIAATTINWTIEFFEEDASLVA